VEVRCKATCGCKEALVPALTHSAECVDTADRQKCKKGAKKGKCETKRWFRNQCKESCGLCKPRRLEHDIAPNKSPVFV
jgi:hypothetical protein